MCNFYCNYCSDGFCDRQSMSFCGGCPQFKQCISCINYSADGCFFGKPGTAVKIKKIRRLKSNHFVCSLFEFCSSKSCVRDSEYGTQYCIYFGKCSQCTKRSSDCRYCSEKLLALSNAFFPTLII